jgi:hypothetical protein
MPTSRTITITDVQNGNLVLDNPVEAVDNLDTVTWVIGTTLVTSIAGIADSSGNDVFNPDPAPVASSSNWSGTISSVATGQESYTIAFTMSGQGSKVFKHDPIIQVKPKK